jgi:hypothetical protein
MEDRADTFNAVLYDCRENVFFVFRDGKKATLTNT